MTRHNNRYQIQADKWGISTKDQYWAPKQDPGPYPEDRSVPLLVVVRDILEYAESAREAKMLLGERKVKVDGRVTTNEKRPLGLMNVVSIPSLKENYRVLYDQKGQIRLSSIEESQSEWKLCKIVDKVSLKGGKTQYNLHDGRNIVLDDANKFRTKNVLKIQMPSQKVLDMIQFRKGNMALITGGKHIGEIGNIEKYEIMKGPQDNLVHFDSGISTIEDYVFPIGEDTPEIKIPEVGIV